MARVDAYLFPCVQMCAANPSLPTPAQQVQQVLAVLKGINYTMIWVDVEILDWFSDQQTNRDFLETITAELDVSFYGSHAEQGSNQKIED